MTYVGSRPSNKVLTTADIADSAVTAAKIADGTVVASEIADGTITSAKIASGVIPTSRPNVNPIIINGNMAVAQRATSATGKTTGDIYTVDRMKLVLDAQGTYTVAQESLTSGNAFANGFANAWRVDCTTADASPSASDQLAMQYTFEGQDLQVFKKGTANAEKFTLAFWVKSNKTGTGNIQLKDKDNSNRQCTQSYTISVANTWEHKVCVFGADTTGAFGDDNNKSLIINWYLGSGTDSSSGTANHGTWEAQDQTKVNDGGTLNINDNTANDWSITGIQLEVGEYSASNVPNFQHESYGDNLWRCKRYYQGWGSVYDTGTFGISGRTISGNRFDSSTIMFIPEMRAAPTIAQGGTADIENYVFQSDGDSITAGSGTSFAALNTQKGSTKFRVTSNATLSANRNANCQSGGGDGKQHLTFDSEL